MADLFNSLKNVAEEPYKREFEDLEKLCSCCLTSGNLVNMYDNIDDNGKVECYIDVINRCYNSQMLNSTESHMKHYICSACIQRLLDSKNFKKQVLDTQKMLVTFFRVQDASNNDIKTNEASDRVEEFIKEDSVGIKSSVSDNDSTGGKVEGDDSDFDESYEPPKNAKSSSSGKSHEKKKKKSKTSDGVKSKKKNVTIYASMDTKNMTCLVCEKKFQSYQLLSQHMNEHFINYTCEICGKGFATTSRRSRHMRRHRIGVFKCPVCEKTFDTVAKLDDHRSAHRESKYICQYCSRRFKTFYTRQKHMVVSHAEVTGFPCQLCPTVCYTSPRLTLHMKQKHEERVRKHCCDVCGRQFYEEPHLINHMVIHTGQRNHSCVKCGKAFRHRKTLIQHMKIHFNVRSHVCTICSQAFVQKSSLNCHMRKHQRLDGTLPEAPKAADAL